MPQPDFVPVQKADEVRETERLPVPDSWVAERPAEIKTVHQPSGKLLGNAGPDQGYALKLIKGFSSKLQLQAHEHEADAFAGVLAVGLKRASLYGRAPVIYDFEHAFTLFGFLGSAPDDLLSTRRDLFAEASHHYEAQRAIADAVPESTLRLTPTQVQSSLSDWRKLVSLPTA